MIGFYFLYDATAHSNFFQQQFHVRFPRMPMPSHHALAIAGRDRIQFDRYFLVTLSSILKQGNNLKQKLQAFLMYSSLAFF